MKSRYIWPSSKADTQVSTDTIISSFADSVIKVELITHGF